MEGMEKWRNEETENKLRRKLISCLREKPILDFCSYVIGELDGLAKKRLVSKVNCEKCKQRVSESGCKK